MEEWIKSSLAGLGKRRAELSGRIGKLRGELAQLEHEYAATDNEAAFYYSMLGTVRDASKVRRKNRKSTSRKKVEAGVEAGRTRKGAAAEVPGTDAG
jgi:hypothetical protein